MFYLWWLGTGSCTGIYYVYTAQPVYYIIQPVLVLFLAPELFPFYNTVIMTVFFMAGWF